ncbi:MAG: DUF3825 domain-containing protein [Clostridiaceae bacterium]|jgi:hypothetical protein|nr:DUF3825 domain-containing protein [Clostridiaceae bacterium]
MKGKNIFALFEFAYCPKYNDAINYLATSLADSEPWDFSDATEKKHTILKNYLEHIFRKVHAERNIAYTQNNSHACFNTGLITKNLEEIYAFFEARRPLALNDNLSAPYVLKAFLKKSDNTLLRIFAGNLPDIANFFNKPEDLIFNPRCELIPQIDHIIEDNVDRFPIHMKGLELDEIRRRLEGAIREVKQRVKTNYKLAVPQYYNNKIQLLLPLCLTPGSPNADLALVAHKISESSRVVYTARTCLTLKMAYNNARLIVKPQSSWLIP